MKRLDRSIVAKIVIAILIAIQVRLLFNSDIQRVYRVWAEHWPSAAWERSAVLLEGDDFADYIRFLRGQIPMDGRVLLPPHLHEYGPFQYVTFLQYFLFPRELLNCGVNEVEACIERVLPGDIYILALEDFPPPQLIRGKREFVSFEGEVGVYLGSNATAIP